MEFSRSDFETLNKLAPSGRINGSIDMEIYWFHAIAKKDAAFFQSRKMHRHQFFELHFILGGEITYVGANGVMHLKKGEYLLIAPDEGHKIESCSGSLLKCSVAFTVGSEEELYGALISKCGSVYKLCGDLEEGIRFITSLSEAQTPYYGMLVKNRLFELIHIIAGNVIPKKHRELQDRYISGMDARIFKVKQFVKDNPHVFFGCEELAAYCGLSVKQLNRLFLKHEGTSLLKYLHTSKSDAAKKLLLSGDMPLRELSEDLGFSNVYYFCRFFRRLENMTPGEFRKAFKNSREERFDEDLPSETEIFN